MEHEKLILFNDENDKLAVWAWKDRVLTVCGDSGRFDLMCDIHSAINESEGEYLESLTEGVKHMINLEGVKV